MLSLSKNFFPTTRTLVNTPQTRTLATTVKKESIKPATLTKSFCYASTKKGTVEYAMSPDIIQANKSSIKSLASNINNVHEPMRPDEMKSLLRHLIIVEPYIKNYAEFQNVKYNKYRWNNEEKEAILKGIKQMNKKPFQITKEDLPGLSLFVITRSPIQCRRYLDYRIKNKMVGFV